MSNKIILTASGLKKLQKELEYLKKEKRLAVAERIQVAKEYGDLSENAEYHDAKEEQAFVEGRILEIENTLKLGHIVNGNSRSGAGVGSRLVLLHEKKRKEFEIVGSTESDPSHGKISVDSPLGQALLGKMKGETIDLATPGGTVHYRIDDII